VRKILLIICLLVLVVTPVLAASGISIVIDGQKADADVIMKDGHAYVPLRFISENFGHKVDWDGTTQTVNIDTGAIKQTSQQYTSYIQQVEDLINKLEAKKLQVYNLINNTIDNQIAETRKTIDYNKQLLAEAFKQTSNELGGFPYEKELLEELAKEEEKFEIFKQDAELRRKEGIDAYNVWAVEVDQIIKELGWFKSSINENSKEISFKSIIDGFYNRAEDYLNVGEQG